MLMRHAKGDELMNHHVDLKAPAFLYLEGIYKGKVNDDKTEDFDFDSGSFEEFVSRYVYAHLFDTQEFQQKSKGFIAEHWEELIKERPILSQNTGILSMNIR